MNIIKIKKVVLLLGDCLLLYLALLITLIIRYDGSLSLDLWQQHLAPFTLLFILWLIVFFINNLYSVPQSRNDFKFYSYLLKNLAIITIIGFAFFYVAPTSITSLKPFRVLIIQVAIFSVLFLLWRRLFYFITSKKSLTNNTLFIGINKEATELALLMQENPQLGYSLKLILTTENLELPEKLRDIPQVKDIADITSKIRQHKIQSIVTVGETHRSANVSQYLFETLTMGLSYFTFPDFYERLTGKIPIDSLEKSWFLENLLSGQKAWYEFNKRFQDIFFSIIFGTLSLPLLPFIAAGIKLSSKGPLIFKQTRTGKGGRTFMAMKFRSMIINAEAKGPQWATKNDSRVTSFGKFLRKTRLDEIPQFINILRGEMSFVGPRPERPEFVSMLTTTIPFYKERLLIKPGLTGWAQINFKYGDSVADAMVKLQYDLFYIKNRSFALDLSIVLKTVNTVIFTSFGQ